jgi:hypothetical protein
LSLLGLDHASERYAAAYDRLTSLQDLFSIYEVNTGQSISFVTQLKAPLTLGMMVKVHSWAKLAHVKHLGRSLVIPSPGLGMKTTVLLRAM